MRAVLSCDAVTMRVPSGLKAAEDTGSSWPLSTQTGNRESPQDIARALENYGFKYDRDA
jgi:hypothetical protein